MGNLTLGFRFVVSDAVGLAFALLAVGCHSSSDETVRERDRLRQETARTMPGNNVPEDPADQEDRAPTDPALEQPGR